MHDNNKLQKALDCFETNFDKLNRKILLEIAEDMKKFKGLIPSQSYKLQQQLKNGRTLEKIKSELEQFSNLTNQDIDYILELTAKDNIDFANTYYKYKNLSILDYSTSNYFKNIVNSVAMVTKNEFKNLSRTTAIKLLDSSKNPMYLSLDEAYNEVIDRCALSVQTGQKSYNEAIYDTINQLSSSGIKKIYYNNDGKRAYARRLDSSVRMNVLDAVRQVSMQMQNKFDEDLGFDGKEITAHVPCAVDHQDIQGRQFSNEDYEKLNDELNRPIGTLNCTHFTFNIILGVSKPRYTDEELERMKQESNKKTEFQGKEYTKYEATQVQRKLETKLRDLKYKRDMLRIVDEPEQLTKVMKEITDTTKLYKDFSDTMGLEYQINRTRPLRKNNNTKQNSLIPHYEMENNKRYVSDEKIKQLANNMNDIVSKHTINKSKWSGNIAIDNNAGAGKLWSCDIRIGNNTIEQELSHELLHAHSISYFDEDTYLKYIYDEEATVEFFNKQICLKEKIPYYENGYSNMVNSLEQISDIMNLDRYEFAKELFNIKVTERESYLRKKFSNNINEKELINLLEEAFVKWNM